MSNPPPPHASPVLSLPLAGIFGAGGAAEEAGEGSNGRGPRKGTVQIMSSENSTGLGKIRSTYGNDNDDEEENDFETKKRRNKFNRHTPEQIQAMEALFKEYPHPDEKQRQQVGTQFGLHPKQVKFWFQNRRTQIKATLEHDENTLLKSEIQKLRSEDKGLRNTNEKSSCLNCGFSREVITSIEEQQLRNENSRLKAEIEKLRSISDSVLSGKYNENGRSLDFYTRDISHRKLCITDIVNQSMSQLRKMANSKEPLWVKSSDTGPEVLNYHEYMKAFCKDYSYNMQQMKSIEASREIGIVAIDLQRLIQSFMDVNQWREMFPCLILKAVTLDVICCGEGVNRDGAVQLLISSTSPNSRKTYVVVFQNTFIVQMFAEIQMLTPMVETRKTYFVRYCKQLTPSHWGIVDVSIDDKKMDTSLQKCSKRPSGCIIEVQSTGCCKVTWVEHMECQNSRAHSLYLNIVNSGLAFGAKRWISTLQQQCERLLFLDATNIPTQDSAGNATLAGKKSLLKLAQRMTRSFCRTLGASSYDSWNKVTTKSGEDIRLASRRNMIDPGEPFGTILCAASSMWLPVSHQILFNLLTDEKRRNEWDFISTGYSVQSTVNLVKGTDRKNSVTVLAMINKENKIFILQDTSRNNFESIIVYAPMDRKSLKSVMSGSDSYKTAVLASGFSILPDGIKSKSDIGIEGGCLVSIGYQILISESPTTQVPNQSVDSFISLISCTLHNIRKCLRI